MKLKVKKLRKNAVLPRKAHPTDAAFDLIVPQSEIIKPGRNVVLLGIAIELPPYHQGMIEARSGFSAKGMDGLEDGLRPKKFDADVISGKIDSGYRGEIGVIIYNFEGVPFTLTAGSRIAQLTISEIAHIDECKEVDELSESDRQNNGFGSTGSV